MSLTPSSISINLEPFPGYYFELYKEGKTGLGRLSRIFGSAGVRACRNAVDLEKAYTSLYQLKLISQITIEAEKKYYEETNAGKVKQFTQNLLKKLFGIKTSLDEAREVQNKLNLYLGTNNVENNPAPQVGNENIPNLDSLKPETKQKCITQATFDAANIMATHCGIVGNRNTEYTIGKGNNEKQVFFKPNGDFYATHNPSQTLFLLRPERHVYKICPSRYLGAGNERIVYLAERLSNSGPKTEVALSISNSDSEIIENTKRAVSFSQRLKSIPNVIKTQETFVMNIGSYDNTPSKRTFSPGNQQAAYVVTDLYQGDLQNYLNNARDLSLEQRKHLIFSLIEIFEKLHRFNEDGSPLPQDQVGIVHRDMKPENILLKIDSNGLAYPILSDFGLAVSLENSKKEQKQRSFYRATPRYAAPEYIKASDETLDANPVTKPPIDIWALGLTCFQIWYGNSPTLSCKDEPELYMKDISKISQTKIENEFTLNEKYKPSNTPIEKAIVAMIRSMLLVDPSQRATAAQLKKECESIDRLHPDQNPNQIQEEYIS
jgi:serine/threonine protein kinase